MFRRKRVAVLVLVVVAIVAAFFVGYASAPDAGPAPDASVSPTSSPSISVNVSDCIRGVPGEVIESCKLQAELKAAGYRPEGGTEVRLDKATEQVWVVDEGEGGVIQTSNRPPQPGQPLSRQLRLETISNQDGTLICRFPPSTSVRDALNDYRWAEIQPWADDVGHAPVRVGHGEC